MPGLHRCKNKLWKIRLFVRGTSKTHLKGELQFKGMMLLSQDEMEVFVTYFTQWRQGLPPAAKLPS